MTRYQNPIIAAILARRHEVKREARRRRAAQLAKYVGIESHGWYWTDLKGGATSSRAASVGWPVGAAAKVGCTLPAPRKNTWHA
jgi:hypothetical protein